MWYRSSYHYIFNLVHFQFCWVVPLSCYKISRYQVHLVVILHARQVITQVAAYHVGATTSMLLCVCCVCLCLYCVCLCVYCVCVCGHISGMCVSKTYYCVIFLDASSLTNSQIYGLWSFSVQLLVSWDLFLGLGLYLSLKPIYEW